MSAEALTYCPLKGDLCDATPCLGIHTEAPCQPELIRVAKQIEAEYSTRGDAPYDKTNALAAVQRISDEHILPYDIVLGRITNLVRFYSKNSEFSLQD